MRPSWYIMEDYAVCDLAGTIVNYIKETYTISIPYRGKYNISTRKYGGKKYDKDVWSDPFSKSIENGKIIGYRLNKNEQEWGFIDKRSVLFVTKDGMIYDEMDAGSSSFFILDGNMQFNLRYYYYTNTQKSDIDSEDVYWNRENDTNIEFRYFKSPHETVSSKLATEWFEEIHSKDLIHMMDRSYKFGKSNEEMVKERYPERYKKAYPTWSAMCNIKWEYSFDRNGNICDVLVENDGSGIRGTRYKGRIHVEYVY